MKLTTKIIWGIAIFLTTLAILAQDDIPSLAQVYTEPTSGITVSFPDIWVNMTNDIGQDGSEKLILIVNSLDAMRSNEAVQPDDMIIQISPVSLLNPMVGGLAFEDAWEILTAEGVVTDDDTIVDVFDYKSKARFGFGLSNNYIAIRGLVELADGTYTFVRAITHPDSMDEALPIFFAIGGNLTYTETIFNTLFASTRAFKNEAETFAISYPQNVDWVAYEEDEIVVITNAGIIEDFTADDGQYLIIVSAVPSAESDSSALLAGMLSGVMQNIAFPIPPLMIKADGGEIETLGKLEGLVGKQAGEGFSVQTAVAAPAQYLPEFSISTDQLLSRNIEIDEDLVAIISVYGSPSDAETINSLVDLIAQSLRIPVDLSFVGVSDIPLSITTDEGTLTVQHPDDWETFSRGGFNVMGIPPEGKEAIRLIMSGRSLEAGETVEDSLLSIVQLFGYEIFDTVELNDGRVVYIGTNVDLTEAVFKVAYDDGYVVAMSFLPTNPDDFMVGLPVALAILESIELKID